MPYLHSSQATPSTMFLLSPLFLTRELHVFPGTLCLCVHVCLDVLVCRGVYNCLCLFYGSLFCNPYWSRHYTGEEGGICLYKGNTAIFDNWSTGILVDRLDHTAKCNFTWENAFPVSNDLFCCFIYESFF